MSAPDRSALVTVTGLARIVGIDPRTARSALDRAGIEPVSGQRYRRGTAEAAIRANVDADKVLGNATSGRGTMEAGQLSEFGGLATEKHETARLRNEKLRLDLDVKRGKLVDRADVMSAGADIIRRATFHFLAIGQRAAPKLVGITDPAAIADVIETEARASLAELADMSRIVEEIVG